MRVVITSLMFLTNSGVGAPIGALAASFFADRLDRHTFFIACCAILGASGLGFALFTDLRVAMALGAACARRGLATGLGYATFRAGAALAPLLLLPLLLQQGATVLFMLVAGFLLLAAVLVLLFGPRGTTGQALH